MPSQSKKTNYTRKIIDDYCVLDVETTGVSPYFDEIIEIAMLRVRNNQIVERYSQLIHPETRISAFITNLTGITNGMVRNKPSIWEVQEEVLSFLGNDIILGHNTSFDVRFISAAFDIHLENPYMDTYQFSRKVFPELGEYKLSFLSRHFNLTNSEHRALADCIATKELYDLIKQTMKASGLEIDDLWKKRLPSANKKESAKQKYEGREKVQRDGRIAKITEYRKYDDIDVLLNDGTIICNTTIEKWTIGRIPGCNKAQNGSAQMILEKKYNGNPCQFGDNRACDISCKYFETCTRACRK